MVSIIDWKNKTQDKGYECYSVSLNFLKNDLHDTEDGDHVATIEPFTSFVDKSTSNIYINACGPVWALDWKHEINQKISNFLAIGPNLVQIWEIQLDHLGNDPSAKLCCGISHNGEIVLDVSWSVSCNLGTIPSSVERIGFLAVCLGDSTIQIFDVKKILPNNQKNVVEACKLLLTIPFEGSIYPLCVKWSPHLSSNILVGLSDGSIMLYDINNLLKNTNVSPQCIRRFIEGRTCAVGKYPHKVAIRCIEWCPYDSRLFMSSGQECSVKIWSIEEPRACLFSCRPSAINWIPHCSWGREGTCTILFSGDCEGISMHNYQMGKYSQLVLPEESFSPIWQFSVLHQPEKKKHLLASCGTSGSVNITQIGDNMVKQRTKNKVTHVLLDISCGDETADSIRHFNIGHHENISPHTNTEIEPPFKDVECAFTRIKWSTSGHALAAGGKTGIIVISSENSIKKLFASHEDYKKLIKKEMVVKHGRPRKNDQPDEKNQTKKKLGRPPRVQKDEVDSASPKQREQRVKNIPTSEDKEVLKQNDTPDTVGPSMRKRGRPRKVDELQGKEPESSRKMKLPKSNEKSDSPKKKRGRPRNISKKDE